MISFNIGTGEVIQLAFQIADTHMKLFFYQKPSLQNLRALFGHLVQK